MKKNISYSALRDTETKSALSFYEDLSHKTLMCIGALTSHDEESPTTIKQIKSVMGINYHALATIIKNLKKSGYITVEIVTHEPADSSANVGPDNLSIKLTKEGLNTILKNMW